MWINKSKSKISGAGTRVPKKAAWLSLQYINTHIYIYRKENGTHIRVTMLVAQHSNDSKKPPSPKTKKKSIAFFARYLLIS